MTTLWKPYRGDLVVPTARFFDYPYFEEMAREHRLPKTLHVRWMPYPRFVQYALSTDTEEEAEDKLAFIGDVAAMIKRGDDVPPLIVDATGEPIDGMHRAWAADSLGLKRAPVAVVSAAR